VAALNHGCAEARGEYIARLDADDTTHERRIAAQVDHLARRPQLGLLGTWARITYENGEEGTFEPPVTDRELRRYLLWDNPFVHSSVMFRRAAAHAAGGYPAGLAEEYRLWIRIATAWQVEILPEILVTHHVHAASVTGRQRRTAALRGRLVAQRDAVVAFGTWSRALPALAVTSGAYLLAILGGGVEAKMRERLRGMSRRRRGFRATGPSERTP
jgi:hypothetical protein